MANRRNKKNRSRNSSENASPGTAVSVQLPAPSSPENRHPVISNEQKHQDKGFNDAAELPLYERIKKTSASSVSTVVHDDETSARTGNGTVHTQTELANNTADINAAPAGNMDTSHAPTSATGTDPEASILSILPQRAQIFLVLTRIGGIGNNCLPRALVSCYDPVLTQVRRIDGYPMQRDAAAYEDRMIADLRTQIIHTIKTDQSMHQFIASELDNARAAGTDLVFEQTDGQSALDAYLQALAKPATQLGEYEIAAAARIIDRCIIVFYSKGAGHEPLSRHHIHNADAATRHLPCILSYTPAIRHFDTLTPTPPLRAKLQKLIAIPPTTCTSHTAPSNSESLSNSDDLMESESSTGVSSFGSVTSAARHPTRNSAQAQQSILLRLTRCPPLIGINKKSTQEQIQKAAPSPRALEEQIRLDILHCGALARSAKQQTTTPPTDSMIRESLSSLSRTVAIKVARRYNYPKVCWALVAFSDVVEMETFCSLLNSVGMPYELANDLRCRGAVLHVGRAAYKEMGRAELDRVLTPFLQRGLCYNLAYSYVGTQLGQIDFICPTTILAEFAQRMKIDFPQCAIIRYSRNPAIVCRRCWRVGHCVDQCRMTPRCSCGIPRAGAIGARCDHAVRECVLCTEADRKKLPMNKRHHPSYACPRYIKDVISPVNFPPSPMHNSRPGPISPVSDSTRSPSSLSSSSGGSPSSYASIVRNGKRARIESNSSQDSLLYPNIDSPRSGMSTSDFDTNHPNQLNSDHDTGDGISDPVMRSQACDLVRASVGAVRDRRLSTVNNSVASRINAMDTTARQLPAILLIQQQLALQSAQIQVLQEQVDRLTKLMQPLIQFCTALQSSPLIMASITAPTTLAPLTANISTATTSTVVPQLPQPQFQTITPSSMIDSPPGASAPPATGTVTLVSGKVTVDVNE